MGKKNEKKMNVNNNSLPPQETPFVRRSRRAAPKKHYQVLPDFSKRDIFSFMIVVRSSFFVSSIFSTDSRM